MNSRHLPCFLKHYEALMPTPLQFAKERGLQGGN